MKKHPEHLTPEEERELAIKAKTGDIDARNKLVESHVRYVHQLARRVTFAGMTVDDQVQEGMLGLMRAVDMFDPTLGVPLTAYARNWIVSFLFHAKHKNSSLVKVPVWLQDGRNKNPVDPPHFFSISYAVQDGNSTSDRIFGSLSCDRDHVAEVDDAEERRGELASMEKAMRSLTKDERKLIKDLFGIGRKNRITVQSLERTSGHSHTTIERKRNSAIAKLRQAMLA